MRTLYKRPEPLLILKELLLCTDPGEEVGKEVADDLKQRYVVIRPSSFSPGGLKPDDAEGLRRACDRHKDDRGDPVIQQEVAYLRLVIGERGKIRDADRLARPHVLEPPGDHVLREVKKDVDLRLDPFGAPLVGVLGMGEVRREPEDVTPVDAEERPEQLQRLLEGVIEVRGVEADEPGGDRPHQLLEGDTPPDLVCHLF